MKSPQQQTEQVWIRFSCKCNTTHFGEELFLLGEHPKLGKWVLNKALKLKTDAADFPWWYTDYLLLPRYTDIEYKYLIVDPMSAIYKWEPINGNRTVYLSDIGCTIQDSFGQEQIPLVISWNCPNLLPSVDDLCPDCSMGMNRSITSTSTLESSGEYDCDSLSEFGFVQQQILTNHHSIALSVSNQLHHDHTYLKIKYPSDVTYDQQMKCNLAYTSQNRNSRYRIDHSYLECNGYIGDSKDSTCVMYIQEPVGIDECATIPQRMYYDFRDFADNKMPKRINDISFIHEDWFYTRTDTESVMSSRDAIPTKDPPITTDPSSTQQIYQNL